MSVLGEPVENFEVFLDMEATSHYISDNALSTVLRDLEQGHFDLNSPESIITGGSGPSAGKDVRFTFAADEPATYSGRLDEDPFVACESPVSYTDLSEGTHRFRVFATDSLGNVDGTPAVRDVTVDATPPQTSITLESTQPPIFRFFSSEDGSSFECSIDDQTFHACASPYAPVALSTGRHILSVRAIDSFGNIDPTPASGAFTIEAPLMDAPVTPLDTVPPHSY